MKKIFFAGLFGLLLWSCQKEGGPAPLTELDLMSNGLPITILAPDSAQVNVSNLGIMQDVTVRGRELDDKYNVQIYVTEAESNDLAALKSDQIAEVRNNRLFSRVVREEPQGFIYELQIDTSQFYSFRYVHVQGDKKYVFTTGLASTFSEAEAERMYEAVKQ